MNSQRPGSPAKPMPSSLDDIPLAEKIKLMKQQKQQQVSTAAAAPGAGAVVKKEKELQDDVPISHRLAMLKRKLEGAEEPSVPAKKPSGNGNKKEPTVKTKTMENKKPAVKKEKDPLNDKPKKRVPETKQQQQKVKKEKPANPKVDDDNQEEEEKEQEYKWWEEGVDGDTSVKWERLEHNGPLFPPPYQPHGVPMIYDGEYVHLEPEPEEVASFFGALLGTDHAENPTFQENFFADFRTVLIESGSRWAGRIREFSKCDFTPMHRHFEALKERRKAMTKEEKLAVKDVKAKEEKEYGYAVLDGRREKIGNFRVEPPGLFRGRGKHPKTGKLKRRVQPEQVTINIGESAPVPAPPPGHSWGKVIHDNTVTWLATWVENINGAQKYVFLAPGSSLKGQSDLRKFETARRLKAFVDEIRRVNARELHDKEMFVRQRATALWLIDHLALRAGNEKGDDEADTVGCCSLRLEHIQLEEPSTVVFDFLGKDSIRYYNSVRVEPIIFKNLSIFMRPPKTPSDPIFDRLNTSTLNKYLNGLMEGLTAKVFRTFNASFTFQRELDGGTEPNATTAEKVLAYNRANRQVAILCNHQRSVPKTHGQSMDRLREKILTMKYQRMQIRLEARRAFDKKSLKSDFSKALEDESDMDDEVVERKRQEAIEAAVEKYKKSHDDSSPDKATLKDLLTVKLSSMESAVKKFDSLSTRIHAARHLLIDKDENKTTALGTSKTNYIDPRITAAWCAKHDVPIEKMFTKTLREKFKWAMTVDSEWKF